MRDEPSSIVLSVGLISLLDLSRFPLESEEPDDRVTALGPIPPAATGFPTPSRVCNSLAFRVLTGIAEGGSGGGGGSLGGASSSFSSAMSCTIIDDIRLGPALLAVLVETDLLTGCGSGTGVDLQKIFGGVNTLRKNKR